MYYIWEVTGIEKLMRFCSLQNLKLKIMYGVELYLLVLLNNKKCKLPVSITFISRLMQSNIQNLEVKIYVV